LGGLLDDPLEAIELDQRRAESDSGRGRRGLDRFDRTEGDVLAPRLYDLGQPRVLIVGDFEALSRLHAQHAHQMPSLVSAQLGGAGAHFVHKEPSSAQIPIVEKRGWTDAPRFSAYNRY